jgi:hypothetical protein
MRPYDDSAPAAITRAGVAAKEAKKKGSVTSGLSCPDKKFDLGFESSGNKELDQDDAAQGEGRAAAGSTPAAAIAATTGAIGATATPAAATSHFSLGGPSQGCSLAPAASGTRLFMYTHTHTHTHTQDQKTDRHTESMYYRRTGRENASLKIKETEQ